MMMRILIDFFAKYYKIELLYIKGHKMGKLSVRRTFNQLTKEELIQYAADNNIPMNVSTTKTGMISHIMRTKKADILRQDAARIIANRE
jgi:hypothetical protein